MKVLLREGPARGLCLPEWWLNAAAAKMFRGATLIGAQTVSAREASTVETWRRRERSVVEAYAGESASRNASSAPGMSDSGVPA